MPAVLISSKILSRIVYATLSIIAVCEVFDKNVSDDRLELELIRSKCDANIGWYLANIVTQSRNFP